VNSEREGRKEGRKKGRSKEDGRRWEKQNAEAIAEEEKKEQNRMRQKGVGLKM